MSKVIGLGGHKESGKDAIADYLVRDHGFVKIGMSDPLNEAMLKLNPLVGIGVQIEENLSSRNGFSRINRTREVRYADIIAERGYVEAKKEPEVRGLLQRFGTDVVRDLLGKDVWVAKATDRIWKLMHDGKDVVLTGVRFENELRMFDRFAGNAKTAWVSRPGYNGDGHASENGVDPADFDVRIHNNATLEDLYETAFYAFDLAPQLEQLHKSDVYRNDGQLVLVDGAVQMKLVGDAPSSPGMAIVESFASGPIVVEKSRLQPIV